MLFPPEICAAAYQKGIRPAQLGNSYTMFDRQALALLPTLLFFFSLAACLCLAKVDPPTELREVVVINHTNSALLSSTATRDGWTRDRPMPRDKRITLRLPAGRHAIRIGSDGPRVPLPLPLEELGYVVPATMELHVWPWPKAEKEWCWIPAGPSLRGDDLGIGQEDERPVSTPTTAGFWLAQNETSNAQYAAFLNAIDRSKVDVTWLDLEGRKCRVQWSDDDSAYVTDAPTLPLVTVSHAGAEAYCRWLTKTTKKIHRLPNETEWEKAARGPGSRVYAYGDTFRTASANQESGHLVAISKFKPNGFGLYDMTGNAFEWMSNSYARDAYQTVSKKTNNSTFQALRGGSFVLDGIFVRNSMRMRLRPEVRADDVGFRVLRETLKQQK